MRQEIKITPETFIPEKINEVKELGGVVGIRYLALGATLLAGGAILKQEGNTVADALIYSGLVTMGFQGLVFSNWGYSVFSRSALDRSFPNLVEKGSISTEKLTRLIEDKTSAVAPSLYQNPLIHNLKSLVPYKTKLINEYAKSIESEAAALTLWSWLTLAPNLEIKRSIIDSIGRFGKNYLAQNLKNKLADGDFANDVERAAANLFALDWNLVSDQKNIRSAFAESARLKIFDSDNFYHFAGSVADRVVQGINPALTLVPFARLFVWRRIKEIVGGNRLLSHGQTVDILSRELRVQLDKFNREKREVSADQNSVTIGIEVQPEIGNLPIRFFTDKKELNQITKFVGLPASVDDPFELVMLPNIDPVGQLLAFREILLITGIPPENAGVQLNFGGIGKDRKNIAALQRLVLASKRLRPIDLFASHGDYWDLGFFLKDKGEFNLRSRKNPEVKTIMPPEFNHMGFDTVAELRAPVGAENFFVFARGVFAAHDLAKLVRASEQGYEGGEAWPRLCAAADEVLAEHQLPGIKEKWSNKTWRRFAKLTK